MTDNLILDRYRPLANLGRGSHGRVVLAYDTRMARRVAIKSIELTPADAAILRTSDGLAEARTSAMLNHPNIVTMYDWDAGDDGSAFLIMEAVDGVSLAELIGADGPLEPAETAAVVADVAEALRFAHANGVLHLDIKPENVLVTRDGLVKVADFGVSRLTGLGGTARAVAGTPGYMAPEQLSGLEVDERADVFGLAALTYLMLTGHEPFPARTVPEAVRRLKGPDPDEPSRFDAELEPEVDDVVFDGLCRDPDGRFDSAIEFADALLPLLGDLADGRDLLAEDVDAILDDDVARQRDAEPRQPLRLWDIVAEASPWILRAAVALAALGMSYAGFTGMSVLPAAVSLAAAAIVGMVAAIAPGLGLGLGFIAVTIGTGLQIGPLQAIAVGAGLAALWWFWGREGSWTVVGPLYEPALALFKLAPAGPPLFGFFMRPLQAAVASALAAALLLLGSATSGFGPPMLAVDPGLAFAPWSTFATHSSDIAGVFHPSALLMIVVWALSGAAGSVIARQGGRVAGFVSVTTSLAILLGGYLVWATVRGFEIATTDTLAQFSAALMLLLIVAAVGPPPELVDEPLEFDEDLEAADAID